MIITSKSSLTWDVIKVFSHSDEILEDTNLSLENILKISFMMWKLKTPARLKLLVADEDGDLVVLISKIHGTFEQIHRRATEECRNQIANNQFIMEDYIEDLVSFQQNMSKKKFFEFYIKILTLVPEAQWPILKDTIWQNIRTRFVTDIENNE